MSLYFNLAIATLSISSVWEELFILLYYDGLNEKHPL